MDNRELVMDAKTFKVYKGDVKYNDGVKNEYFVESPEGVAVLALTKDKKLVLIEEYRSFEGGIVLKTPGGGIEKGETPIIAAQRELLE